MKACIADSVKRLEKAINHMVEAVRDIKSSEENFCAGSAQQYVEQSTPFKLSTNSLLKHGRAQTVPIK
ncbi:hypothetical protein Bca4012_019686 [Brassica carinata]|uniref:Uncharacterized protein n=1 Tax=Brassica carinata TaxID=52824 RepID=A0A8X7WMH0_BRACI|nr:hypothetical protein Bca52824_001928 [Brassica carinata]